ncbi:hypothetical protein SKAU_G00278280 [Synaphobranchus kaupii]|uniref:Uncharacterized protein n=1 Tax=Synaphobranchus kaupii TaxID=118154 RepID=A0A9Q1EWL7_SYNKA|nr:hypothetical protein SKAU_G00278280 [Synaphobranchus kaupii]
MEVMADSLSPDCCILEGILQLFQIQLETDNLLLQLSHVRRGLRRLVRRHSQRLPPYRHIQRSSRRPPPCPEIQLGITALPPQSKELLGPTTTRGPGG